MKLNLGCFGTSIKGFKNVDIRKLPGVDIVCDIRKLDFAKDNTIDAIYASHVLEHFYYKDTDSVLKEWARVLKPGGKIYIAVPNMDTICAMAGIYGYNSYLENVTYGTQEYEHSEHKSGFGFEKLKAHMGKAGFVNVEQVKLFPFGVVDASTMQFIVNGKPLGVMLSLNVIGEKGRVHE